MYFPQTGWHLQPLFSILNHVPSDPDLDEMFIEYAAIEHSVGTIMNPSARYVIPLHHQVDSLDAEDRFASENVGVVTYGFEHNVFNSSVEFLRTRPQSDYDYLSTQAS